MASSEQYPTTCPFCRISKAYPPSLESPIPLSANPAAVSPQCHLLLSTPYVLAFLDILPISPGHILLTTRDHFEKLSDILPRQRAANSALWTSASHDEGSSPSQALGYWMPLLSRALAKALDIEDWNVVQNNGARAAQVVPHVHFHFIPRYAEDREQASRGTGKVDVGMLKSWKMFGRSTREELDDEEAVELSQRIRAALKEEVRLVGRAKRGRL